VESRLAEFLKSHSLTARDLDLVIQGKNGDTQSDEIYSFLERSLLQEVPACSYKHLCGEYPTSTAFALWFCQGNYPVRPDSFRRKKQAGKKRNEKSIDLQQGPV
jgi:hypothetical protein